MSVSYGICDDRATTQQSVVTDASRRLATVCAGSRRAPDIGPGTIEAGLLTPTLKAKRDVVQGMFAREINALYAEPTRSRLRPN